jgi:hypothetical protein
MNAERHFAASYREARAKFLAATRAATRCGTAELDAARGPDGEALSVDWAWLGAADSPAVVIVVSGTHGIEGFCGSAVQCAWLERASLHESCAVLLVHALNPFGMAWATRCDHENIDVNRNFVAFPEGCAPNRGYRALHAILCPRDWTPARLAEIDAALAAFERAHGAQMLTDALIGAQSGFADGLNFTGRAPSWSRLVIERLWVDVASRRPAHVVLLDLHAGVAARGEVALLAFHDAPEAVREAREMFDLAAAAPGFQFGAPGLARYAGLLVQDAGRLLGPSARCAVAEFGTIDRAGIRHALRLDRWLRFHGAGDPRADALRAELLDAFCPRDSEWRRQALTRGVRLIDTILERLTWGRQR